MSLHSTRSQRPTIAAIATAAAPAAVGLLRISGPEAISIANQLTGGKASKAPERQAFLSKIYDQDGQLIDETLVTCFRGPRSYTGEDVCEIAGHGGMLVMRSLLDRVLTCGAVLAGPGEFTQQAFLQGKLDLTQAEGIMDLISAQTHHAMRAAHEQREGRLGQHTETLRDALVEHIAHIEAYIDFPEEDISPEVGQILYDRLHAIQQQLDQLIATADMGRILREGVRTVIFGAPNTGKSSLLNRLLGFERAIVSDIAGTTRDTIEETVNCQGVLLRLIDTAGLREHTDDRIEQEGMRRSSAQREQADLTLALFDATEPCPTALPEPSSEHQMQLLVLNKCDQSIHPSWLPIPAIHISCLSGTGLSELGIKIRDTVYQQNFDHGQSLVAINARHKHCLQRASEAVVSALALLSCQQDFTLVSIELREAIEALGEISGKIDSDDILGVIFSRFCIGK